MYRVRWPSNNCHQIPSKCTKSHTCIEFQKLSGWIPPDSRRLGALSPDTRPRLGKWQGGNPSNWIGLEYSLTPHSTQYRSFQRRSSQPITWLILTNKTVQENTDKQTQYKSETVDNLKYSKTKLPWFSCLLQHSAGNPSKIHHTHLYLTYIARRQIVLMPKLSSVAACKNCYNQGLLTATLLYAFTPAIPQAHSVACVSL